MVIVLDNDSVYASDLVKTKLKQCEKKRLYLSCLPIYSLKANIIQGKQYQIKVNKIAGSIIEDKDNLVKAVQQSLNQSSCYQRYQLKQYKLNPNCLNIEV